MKYIISKLFLMVMLVFTVLFSSCDNDPHDPDIELSGNVSKYFPSYCVNLSTSYSGSNKFFSMTCEPHFYFNPSDWDINIDKIDYYVDDEYCQTETVSPFTFKYESHDWYIGAHNVRADITISGKNIETFVLQCTKVIDNSSSQEKAADVWFDYDYATTGQVFFISGNINHNRSASGTIIRSFSAKWDGESIGEVSDAPYKLTRTMTDMSGTKHSVSATLVYKQGSIETSYTFSMSSYEIPGPTSVMQTFKLKSRYNDYQNGETLEGVARQFIGNEVKSSYKFELYLDNVLIGSSTSFPYELSYKLVDLTLGEHTLKKQWVRYDENGNRTSSFSTDEIITITK